MWKGPINDRGEENHLKGGEKKKKKKKTQTDTCNIATYVVEEADNCRVIEEKPR